MLHDLRLRAAVRAIYDACYPGGEWAPVGFDEAERFKTIHYRQALEAACQSRWILSTEWQQQDLFADSPLKAVA